MTYFTYVKSQCSDYKVKRETPFALKYYEEIERYPWYHGIHRYSSPPKKIPLTLPKPSFMPTYLVRTSDMKVVPGSEVPEGYCTLSYSWNQSGEIVINESGKKSHRRIDEGKHRIIYPAKTVRKKARGRKRIPRKVKYVKFEGLIQEICKDFNIKYIWYDQMCINQDDNEEKHREIRQMHKIYSNSYCKIALIPELELLEEETSYEHRFLVRNIWSLSLQRSEWMKRIWTLEEAVMSSRMLLVGSNVHWWWYRTSKSEFPMFHQNSHLDASRILHSAHARRSTKEHDHVFALANIFPETMDEITIDYNQDIQELMIQFYGALARKDLSILCFQKHGFYQLIFKDPSDEGMEDENTNETKYTVPIQEFDLPSWTGVDGEHIYHNRQKTSFKNYTIIGRVMHVTCTGMTNVQHHTERAAITSITLEDIPPMPEHNTKDDYRWTLLISVRPAGSANDKLIAVYNTLWQKSELDPHDRDTIVNQLLNLSHFIPVKKMDFQWKRTPSQVPWATIDFRDLTETPEASGSYVLLHGIKFTDPKHRQPPRYPIIKKYRDCYKVIGVCDAANFFDDIALEERVYEIH